MNRSINNFWGAPVWILFACACASGSSAQQTVKPATVTPAVVQPVQVKKAEPPQEKPMARQSAVERLKEWDKKLHFLKTDFTQTTSYDGVVISRSRGVLYYDQGKNTLRLDTQDGDGTVVQSAVTDKKKIFILDDKGKEVSHLSWQEWQQGQPNQALFDFGNYAALLERHHVKMPRTDLLVLTPKEGELYTLHLTLRTEDYFPRSIKFVSGDMTTQADLTNIQQNKPLPPATFGGFFK